ncbi:hypothetical protein BU17DRAFT_102002 [Hysterangium stoloniferum]|nr:hypothetical protein BU17DRAFT_102002 [Hysterangium stoloniferum]
MIIPQDIAEIYHDAYAFFIIHCLHSYFLPQPAAYYSSPSPSPSLPELPATTPGTLATTTSNSDDDNNVPDDEAYLNESGMCYAVTIIASKVGHGQASPTNQPLQMISHGVTVEQWASYQPMRMQESG